MTKSIESTINSYVKTALKGKQTYYESLQTAYEIFVAHYNKELNHNSQPLFNILKASGKDIQAFKNYVYKSTNITKLALSDKNGLLLTFDSEFTYNNDYIDSFKWYDKPIKDDDKAIKELDDNAFYKRLNSLLKAIDNSTKLSINKERVKATLNSLVAQTKQAIDNNKQ